MKRRYTYKSEIYIKEKDKQYNKGKYDIKENIKQAMGRKQSNKDLTLHRKRCFILKYIFFQFEQIYDENKLFMRKIKGYALVHKTDFMACLWDFIYFTACKCEQICPHNVVTK